MAEFLPQVAQASFAHLRGFHRAFAAAITTRLTNLRVHFANAEAERAARTSRSDLFSFMEND